MGAWPDWPASFDAGRATRIYGLQQLIAQVGVAYAHGPVIIGCNTGGFWQSNTDNVLRVTGLTTLVLLRSFSRGTVALSAQLVFDGGRRERGTWVIWLNGTEAGTADIVAGGTL